MKKIVLSIIYAGILLGDNFNIYTFSLKENYWEIANGGVVDKNYNKFGEMFGIGTVYTKNLDNLNLIFEGEFAAGNDTYDGAYQDGTPLKVKIHNSYLYNFDASIDFSPYFIKIGYRFWHRGKSKIEGDYCEDYYWPYIASGLDYKFDINKFTFQSIFQYQDAINPQMKAYLGSSPTIDLGSTAGWMADFKLGYKIKKNNYLGIFYKCDFWHINASGDYNLILDNKKYVIFEPESYTLNQYLGVFYKVTF